MNQEKIELLRIPESVKQDTGNFRHKLNDFLSGNTSDISFKAYRVPMGIYEQRKHGSYMSRVRISAGLVMPYQLKKIAELSRRYGDGVVHITTRQDAQIHGVKAEDLADVLEQLLEADLSTRGGGGNTVRNISACPRTGVCPNQVFDVAPCAIAATEYLLQYNDSFNLPRKYKIAFSGCANDCAYASVADLGFFARIKDGQKGFAVYGGGGFGINPSVAIKLEDFVPETDIFEISQAIKEIFDKHGDRTNRSRARLRYVVKRLGDEKFVELYKQKRQEIRARNSQESFPELRPLHTFDVEHGNAQLDTRKLPPNVFEENRKGVFTVKASLKLGNIPAADLIRIAEIAERYSRGFVRTTQSQDLLITSVAAVDVETVCNALRRLSVDVSGREKANITTCTGADTCQLGLCLSKGLADAISKKLRELDIPKETIKISGCPNSCGHHCVADIGFQGRAKRVNDKLMPCYELLTGAKVCEGATQFSKSVAVLAAKDIPDFLYEVYSRNALGTEKFDELVNRYSDFSRDFTDDYFYDYGACERFSLKDRGPGECGAGVLDIVKVDIDDAKNSLKAAVKAKGARKANENAYKAVLSSSRALLVLFGHEPKKDKETVSLFKKELIEAGWVSAETEKLLEAALDWKLGDIDSLAEYTDEIQMMVERIDKLFHSLDSGLQFTVEPATASGKQTTELPADVRVVNLRGVACPMNFVKAKIELEKVQPGQTIKVMLDEGEPIRNVPASFISQGQSVVKTEKEGDHYIIEVRRNK